MPENRLRYRAFDPVLVAINYHYVRPLFDFPYDGVHGVTPAEFENQLTTLSRCGTFVSQADLQQTVKGGRDLPERAIIVTLDDGLKEQYVNALPVLLKLGIPAVFFVNTRPVQESIVCTVHKIHILRASLHPREFLEVLQKASVALDIDFAMSAEHSAAAAQYPFDFADVQQLKYTLNVTLERSARERLIDEIFRQVFGPEEATISQQLYLDRDQLRTLAKADFLGSHGHDHLPLGVLHPSEATFSVRGSLELLRDWTGFSISSFSFPYGSRAACNPWLSEILATCGVSFAFTMERAANPIDYIERLPHFLCRFDCNELPGGRLSNYQVDRFFQDVPRPSWLEAS